VIDADYNSVSNEAYIASVNGTINYSEEEEQASFQSTSISPFSTNGMKRVIMKYKDIETAEFHTTLGTMLNQGEPSIQYLRSSTTLPQYTVNYDFDQLNSVSLTIDSSILDDLVNNLGEVIDYVEEDYPLFPLTDSIETSAPEMNHMRRLAQTLPYGVSMVQAPSMWAKGFTGSGVTVCVIDSGVDASHPDFDSSKLSGASGNNLAWNKDGCKHGTHVAGTIAAKQDSNGVVGVAYGAKMVFVRVFKDDCSYAYTSDVLYAAQQCKKSNAKIINMSLGGAGFSKTAADAFQSLLVNDGILSVAAAGNDGSSNKIYPSSYDSVISVAAINSNRDVANFSQYNSAVDLAAPGVSVPSVKSGSTDPNSLLTYSGTSMATPHVSGVIALLMQAVPSSKATTIRDAMHATAQDRGSTGRDDKYGNGLVQAFNAYQCLIGAIQCGITISKPVCTDNPQGWYDRDGPTFNCSWYAVSNRCSLFGSQFGNLNKVAKQACCACGGGTTA